MPGNAASTVPCIFGKAARCIPIKELLVIPRNVIEGRFFYHGPNRSAEFSHALLTFHDADLDNEISVETAVDQQSLRWFGYRPKEVYLAGCTNRGHARCPARWLVETAHSQRHAISYRASLDHFAEAAVRPGDIILVADPIPYSAVHFYVHMGDPVKPSDNLADAKPEHHYLLEAPSFDPEMPFGRLAKGPFLASLIKFKKKSGDAKNGATELELAFDATDDVVLNLIQLDSKVDGGGAIEGDKFKSTLVDAAYTVAPGLIVGVAHKKFEAEDADSLNSDGTETRLQVRENF